MTALQVREFPQKLYQELKDYSALHHRSMAQQTIAAVDEMIHGSKGHQASAVDASSRMKKRKEILARAEQRRNSWGCNLPSPVDMLAAARGERDQRFDELIGDLGESQDSK